MTTKTPLQSRWGFHPCDYETFLKLKALNKHYWLTLYAFHRWHRWWRKLPENRRGPEPTFAPLFVIDKPWYKPATTHGVAGFKLYPRTVVDYDIVALFHSARRPMPVPVEPMSAAALERVELLYSQLQQFEKEDAMK